MRYFWLSLLILPLGHLASCGFDHARQGATSSLRSDLDDGEDPDPGPDPGDDDPGPGTDPGGGGDGLTCSQECEHLYDLLIRENDCDGLPAPAQSQCLSDAVEEFFACITNC